MYEIASCVSVKNILHFWFSFPHFMRTAVRFSRLHPTCSQILMYTFQRKCKNYSWKHPNISNFAFAYFSSVPRQDVVWVEWQFKQDFCCQISTKNVRANEPSNNQNNSHVSKYRSVGGQHANTLLSADNKYLLIPVVCQQSRVGVLAANAVTLGYMWFLLLRRPEWCLF